MNIGYACLAIAVPGSEMKSCILKNANEDHLMVLIEHNLNSLDTIIEYNISKGIKLFRISSDLIPFGSSMARELPWQEKFAEKLTIIGNKISISGMRVSMHPGQYTVLNSPDESVAKRAIHDLEYHAKVLDCLGLGYENKIILHLGGVYGDKKQAKERFVLRFKELNSQVKNRLVLENDDKLYNIADVLEVAVNVKSPVVYDTLHNAVNPADRFVNDIEWINECSKTWQKNDGSQKIHYSQQNPDKRPGAHSEFIQIDEFIKFYKQFSRTDIDIMLEVKDKNLSAIKCLNCVSNRGFREIETEWAHYKYCVLEKSTENYYAIRELLRDKHEYPAREMYQMIEESLSRPIIAGNAINAAQHVWGYFKEKASESEKKRFQNALKNFELDKTGIQTVKNILLMLARKYQEDYLLKGYYFYI